MQETSQNVPPDTQLLQENLSRIGELTQRLVAAMAQNENSAPMSLDLNQDIYIKAYSEYISDMINNPAKLIEQQVGLWKGAVEQWSQLLSPQPQADEPTASKRPDRRFSDAAWQDNPFYAAMSDYYVQATEVVSQQAQQTQGLDADETKRLAFFTQQYISLMSPSNFLPTNPQALTKAVETNGESLIQGLENLVADLEFNKGRHGVALADRTAFTLGENIATTPGDVVFQNELFQLIQYKPTTDTVHETPLVIFPPWINKYYILDLQPENSFIKYAVDSGLTVFVVSWINPQAGDAPISFEDYMLKGSLVAINEARKITSQEQVNTIGYCISGTLMTCTLAWLAKNDLNPVKTNTFFTTLTDFEEPGELGVFIQGDMIDSVRELTEQSGILDAYYMGQIFSYLRPDNLVYGPAVKSYLMGEKPPAFDLLYWNGDAPNLPGQMTREYLTSLYLNNELIKGQFVFGGEQLDMADITTPFYAVAAQTDHIAPWKSSFKGLSTLSSPSSRFILSGSGHIAGVVNPAGSGKYGYKTHTDNPNDPAVWEQKAVQHKGSWWPDWQSWITPQSGEMVAPLTPGGDIYESIEPAPGSYVK